MTVFIHLISLTVSSTYTVYPPRSLVLNDRPPGARPKIAGFSAKNRGGSELASRCVATGAVRRRLRRESGFMRRGIRCALTAAFFTGASLFSSGEAIASDSYVLFESGQVRPLALSPSGSLLLAVNTPDNRLEIFSVAHGNLIKVDSVPVGLEPVAVAMKNESEAWVVNHVSDSVSIVNIGPLGVGSRVVKTLLVGDEPRDIVFAGPGASARSSPPPTAVRTSRSIRS